MMGMGVLTGEGSLLDTYFRNLNLRRNVLGEKVIYLLVVIPENPRDIRDMYCAYSIFNEVFRRSREEWNMLYFLDEPSRNALVHWLLERMAKKRGTHRSSWYEERLRILLAQEEALIPQRQRTWGMVLQNNLPTVFATNEAYSYRAPGLKAFNSLRRKPELEKLRYAVWITKAVENKEKFTCENILYMGETSTSAEYEKELCDEVGELFSAAVSLEYLYERGIVYSDDPSRPFDERIDYRNSGFSKVADLIALTGYEAIRLAL